jgi:4-deoxy-L-threo-5-hexosulose-uronate ketol-isomerase
MNLDVRYANHPDDAKKYNTSEIREHYLIENLFKKDTINLTYSHVDRIIAGGIMPVDKKLPLEAGKEMGVDYFLERREMGIINIGGPGILILDDVENKLESREGAYVGMGVKEVAFKSLDKKNPAKFYLNSCPAHHSYPTVKIDLEKAGKVHLGTDENLNKQAIDIEAETREEWKCIFILI